uniref:CapA family protein n=1 Tax=Thermorudis sp. TaxID=1969470 RepID=A0A7C2WJ45_9BACT
MTSGGQRTLIFLGDVMLGRLVNLALKRLPPAYAWGDTLPLLQRADARFINLECAITDWGEPEPGKVFCFRTDAKNVEVLRVAHIDAVSLANNHVLDYGEPGLRETLRNLDASGIRHAGAGLTALEAQQPAWLAIDGLRIAFLAATDNQPDWEATADRPGVFYIPIDPADERFQRLVTLVRAAKRAADLVVVSLHWGPNWGYQPLPEHPTAARLLIESGADIIFGHSAHIFRGVEVYRGRPILYSCGDFVDDYAVDQVERNDESFIFQVHLTGRKLARLSLIPTIINEFQARLAEGTRRDSICEKMSSLCRKLGTEVRRAASGLEIELR